MRALVTGGAGFIGSHVVDALVARGDEVVVLDDLSSGKRENLAGALGSGARLVEASVIDPAAVAAVFEDLRPQLVCHLAAQIDVRVSVSDPVLDLGVNVGGTINLLESARAGGVERFVFASTGGAIYGEGDGRELPFDERADCRPDAPYGQSKLAAEGYLGLYRRLYGLDAVALRPGNVYGPRQDPYGEGGVVAIFSAALLGGQAAEGVRRRRADARLRLRRRRRRRVSRRGRPRRRGPLQHRHRDRGERQRAGPPDRRDRRHRVRARAAPRSASARSGGAPSPPGWPSASSAGAPPTSSIAGSGSRSTRFGPEGGAAWPTRPRSTS